MDKKEYSKTVKKNSPKSKSLSNCAKAFVVGGAICALGQGLTEIYTSLGLGRDDAGTLCSVSLIFLGVLITALHIYDKIAKHAGAGTLVPITGFANAMASPAIEFKSEGMITGLGAKMFVIAGPVIVYGVISAVLYGTVLFVIKMFS
ncbi:MAG: stage V sporulation protein AC [Ruminococcus sp.]|nr:stage V sporulation protein AC [Ruminococcus sp.]